MNYVWDIKKEVRVNLNEAMMVTTSHNKVNGKFDILAITGLGPIHIDSKDTEADARTEAMRLTNE